MVRRRANARSPLGEILRAIESLRDDTYAVEPISFVDGKIFTEEKLKVSTMHGESWLTQLVMMVSNVGIAQQNQSFHINPL